jgi:hypothetical protein
MRVGWGRAAVRLFLPLFVPSQQTCNTRFSPLLLPSSPKLSFVSKHQMQHAPSEDTAAKDTSQDLEIQEVQQRLLNVKEEISKMTKQLNLPQEVRV